MTTSGFILLAATFFTALMAGLFFSWSCSVTLGLAKLPDSAYIAAMQAMNRAILNPWFFICFFGTALFLPVSTWLHYSPPLSWRFRFLLTATLLYIVGVLGVTVFGNVPMNEALDAFDLQSSSVEEIAHQRKLFESRWNNLNLVRTVSSATALLCAVLSCLTPTVD